MTDDEIREYATTVVLDHARDIEGLSIYEMAEDNLGHEISDDDAKKVLDLCQTATVTVSWPSETRKD